MILYLVLAISSKLLLYLAFHSPRLFLFCCRKLLSLFVQWPFLLSFALESYKTIKLYERKLNLNSNRSNLKVSFSFSIYIYLLHDQRIQLTIFFSCISRAGNNLLGFHHSSSDLCIMDSDESTGGTLGACWCHSSSKHLQTNLMSLALVNEYFSEIYTTPCMVGR